MRKWLRLIVSISVVASALLLQVLVNSAPAAAATTISNPHKGFSYDLKGNLHAHSNNGGGGTEAPATVGAWYRDNGYGFFTITDHDKVTSNPGVSGIVWLGGGEEDSYDGSSGHMGHINIDSPRADGTDQSRIYSTMAQGGFSVSHHPARADYAGWSADEIDALNGILALEVFNGGGDINSSAIWDAVLTEGKTVWGVASDDSHQASQHGDGYIVVNSASASPSAGEIMGQLRAGNFYASRGCDLAVSVTDLTITASTTTGLAIRWIKQIGTVIKETISPTDTYTVAGDEGYVRIEILDGSGTTRAWSQPLEIDNSAVTTTDILFYRAGSNPNWFVNIFRENGTGPGKAVWPLSWGNLTGDQPLVGNFDGDADDDIAIYRPSNATWYFKRSTGTAFEDGTGFSRLWGNTSGDSPLIGDFDGDSLDDIAIHRAGSYPNWFFKLSSGSGFDTSTFSLAWGNLAGDTPLVGDFNGDGYDDIAIHRAGSYPNWFIRLNETSADGGPVNWGGVWSLVWGNPAGDFPLVGNFDGDKNSANDIDDIAIYRIGSYPNWFFNVSLSADIRNMTTRSLSWGNASGDAPLMGDYNGDSLTDIGIYRINAHPNWFNNNAAVGGIFDSVADSSMYWGVDGADVPLAGEFNGS